MTNTIKENNGTDDLKNMTKNIIDFYSKIDKVDIVSAYKNYKNIFDMVERLSKNLCIKENLNVRVDNGTGKYVFLQNMMMDNDFVNKNLNASSINKISNVDKINFENTLKIILSVISYYNGCSYKNKFYKIKGDLKSIYKYYITQSSYAVEGKKNKKDFDKIAFVGGILEAKTPGTRLSNANTFKNSDVNINCRAYMLGLLIFLILEKNNTNIYEFTDGKVLSKKCFDVVKDIVQKYYKNVLFKKDDFNKNNYPLIKYTSENIPIVETFELLNSLENDKSFEDKKRFSKNIHDRIGDIMKAA